MRLLLNTDFPLIELRAEFSVSGKQRQECGVRAERNRLAYGYFWLEINGKPQPNYGTQTPVQTPWPRPEEETPSKASLEL